MRSIAASTQSITSPSNFHSKSPFSSPTQRSTAPSRCAVRAPNHATLAPAQNEPNAAWLHGSPASFPKHAKPRQSAPDHATAHRCKTNPTSHAPHPATRPHSPVAFPRHSPSPPHDKFKFLPYNPPLSPARAVRAGNLWYGRRPSVEAGDFIQNGPRTQKDRERRQRVRHNP